LDLFLWLQSLPVFLLAAIEKVHLRKRHYRHCSICWDTECLLGTLHGDDDGGQVFSFVSVFRPLWIEEQSVLWRSILPEGWALLQQPVLLVALPDL
jgi:hypothetical protein